MVLALLLIILVVIVLAVVVGVRKRKRGKQKERPQQERDNNATSSYYEFDDGEAENEVSLENSQASQNMHSFHSTDQLLEISEHYEVSSAFLNPASADNSWGINIYYNDVHRRSAEGEFDWARAGEWGGREQDGEREGRDGGAGGYYEELPTRGQNDALPSEMMRAWHKDTSSSNAQTKEIFNPELLYAQPDKSKKNKADRRGVEGMREEKRPLPPHMYARPDMAKKKKMRQQKQEAKGAENKPHPQAFLPRHQYCEYSGESEEHSDTVPELPPRYIPDEERYYNTRGGAVHPDWERNYDYVMVGPNM